MWFEGDPRFPASPRSSWQLAEACTWDGNRQIYVHPKASDNAEDNEKKNLTPFNWNRRVWVGHIRALTPEQQTAYLLNGETKAKPEFIPLHLENINIYYVDAAMDRHAWLDVSHEWYPRSKDGKMLDKGTPEAPGRCRGNLNIGGPDYNCPLVEYFADMDNAVRFHGQHWVFPQTTTFMTTYSNSVYLFRAYRDLSWLYAADLLDASPALHDVLTRAPFSEPMRPDTLHQAKLPVAQNDSQVCPRPE
jgi:hypothetical protein